MKKLLIFLLLSCCCGARAQDSGPAKCGPLKFFYNDTVEVVDAEHFYFGCKGRISSRTIDCDYLVTDLCGAESDYLKSKQMKLVKKRQ